MPHAFLYISLLSVHVYDAEMPIFTFCGRTWTQGNDFLLLFLNFDTAFRTQLQKKNAKIWRIERDKISAIKFEAGLLHFRSRRRRFRLSSLIYLCSKAGTASTIILHVMMYDLLLICGSFSVCLYSQRRKWCNDCSDARRHEKRKGKRSRESDHRLLCYEGNYRMKMMWTVEIQIQMKIWSSQWQLQIKPDKENFETSTSTGSNPVESWARIPSLKLQLPLRRSYLNRKAKWRSENEKVKNNNGKLSSART